MTVSKTPTKRALTEKQLGYVVWAALPEEMRQPKTSDDFCTAMGISRQTIWRWSKDPRVLDAVRHVVIQNAGDPGRVTRILDMVYEVAVEKKNLKAAELWIKSVGIANQLNRSNSILDAFDDEDTFADFSVEELERIHAEMEAEKLEEASVLAAKARLASIGSYEDA